MASTIVELFGYSPTDKSKSAKSARASSKCPFIGKTCTKTLSDGLISGVCTIKPATSGPVICCPIRLYAGDYQILRDVAHVAFGAQVKLILGADALAEARRSKDGNTVAVFGKRWGKELRLPKRGGGGYFVDWILARIGPDGDLAEFVAVEVQSIDTTGNYRNERKAYLEGKLPIKKSTANPNWENVSKRILIQLIFKGHVLRREPLCQKGLFFICPTPVYERIKMRLGGYLEEYHYQAGSLAMRWYDIGGSKADGVIRDLHFGGQIVTTTDQVAKALSSPEKLPPQRVYEDAIRTELGLPLATNPTKDSQRTAQGRKQS